MNGQEFRAWRQRLGLTQLQSASRLGVTQRAIAGWEGDTTPISRQTELAIWAVEQRIELERRLEQLESGRMTTGEKRKRDGAWVDVDTTSESIKRVRAQIAQLDAAAADCEVGGRHYGVAFDVGTSVLSTRGYCISIRNAHKGPITSIEYPTEQDAEAAAEALQSAMEGAIAVTDARGRTWE
jgi:transcriptional regulator with XRE-family HTH domain